MDSKKILYITGSVLLTFGFLYGAYLMTNKQEVVYFESLTKLDSTDNAKWSKDKKNLLIKYSDFECPACATYHNLITSLSENKDNKDIVDKVTFVYRHFPLDQIHKNARVAAYASEAASNQGKFYEFHDKLFDNQAEWSSIANPLAIFEKYAKDLNLDIKKFNDDSKLDATKEKVQSDYVSGLNASVDGTPTFYLNGKKISFGSAAELEKLLRAEPE